jgi:hypothetical protein
MSGWTPQADFLMFLLVVGYLWIWSDMFARAHLVVFKRN